MSGEMTLRDHARAAVRDEVSRQAWRLFARQGFEATTIDQIAEAAGMSRRTFFRYFTGKDELVLSRLVESGDQIAQALRDRPSDEAAWPALRAAFQHLVELQESHADVARPLQVMLRDEPALRATQQERRTTWLELLTPLVADRLPARRRRTGPDTRAAALTGSALACFEAAQVAWASHPDVPLASLLDEAMESVSG
ncbi:TetR family transcriptional regulator [Aeromicrobium chenweiae]|uniref:TetR family transcriptional regulator n=1 Tax=Aeromicrobium chenweiae TaxID=2079793 RepID=A0A2S0WJN2_9ACTN|nr:TetR family transcriptional regulator [Aeromicrobium chenweiae]AWB91543.1 TetR family transcriptional regulator [Aeromicrobium chenweiae]TGN32378.1 TetR family transcriptional regulator [Aeromicrobium chenweiae]